MQNQTNKKNIKASKTTEAKTWLMKKEKNNETKHKKR